MAHISRKELKKDEVRETFAHGAEAVLSHQQLAIYLVIAALVIGLGFYGWKTYNERQTVKASALFDDAMKDFQARIVAPGEQAQPGELTYSDEKMKFRDAARNSPMWRRNIPARIPDSSGNITKRSVSNSSARTTMRRSFCKALPTAATTSSQLWQAGAGESRRPHQPVRGGGQAVSAASRQADRAGAQTSGAARAGRALRAKKSLPGRQVFRADQVRLPRHADRTTSRTRTRAFAR